EVSRGLLPWFYLQGCGRARVARIRVVSGGVPGVCQRAGRIAHAVDIPGLARYREIICAIAHAAEAILSAVVGIAMVYVEHTSLAAHQSRDKELDEHVFRRVAVRVDHAPMNRRSGDQPEAQIVVVLIRAGHHRGSESLGKRALPENLSASRG